MITKSQPIRLPKPIQKPLIDYQNLCVLCSLVSIVHTTTIKHTILPPIIHYMISNILHMSTHNPIKTHQTSQNLSEKHIFITQ